VQAGGVEAAHSQTACTLPVVILPQRSAHRFSTLSPHSTRESRSTQTGSLVSRDHQKFHAQHTRASGCLRGLSTKLPATLTQQSTKPSRETHIPPLICWSHLKHAGTVNDVHVAVKEQRDQRVLDTEHVAHQPQNVGQLVLWRKFQELPQVTLLQPARHKHGPRKHNEQR
jgi:hypothetical protein